MSEENCNVTPWIGVALDGTLAFYDGWRGIKHIGLPIPKMMQRVRQWIAEGKTVKIFTARVSRPHPDQYIARVYIQRWLEANGLPKLQIVCIKDMAMEELWDDRAVQIVRNTGETVLDHFRNEL